MRHIVSGVLVLAFGLGCGTESGTTAVQSRGGPTSFTGISAQFASGGGALGNQPVTILRVAIYEKPLWCTPTDAGTAPTTFAALLVEVARWGAAPAFEGTFPITVPEPAMTDRASALYYTFENDQPDITLQGTSGRLELRRVDQAAAEGTVDVTLEDGTQLQGDFSATVCTQG